MKTCIKCQEKKSFSEFSPHKWGDGYRSTCKYCRSIHESPLYYHTHKKKIQFKKFQKRHQISKYNKSYYKNHNSYFQSYRQSHLQHYKNWRIKHRSHLNQYRKNLKLTNPHFHILCNLRSRTATLLRRCKTSKSNSTLKLLGCSLKQLKQHLEKQFQKGMSWSNYGQWHIDHILPCSSFNLTKPIQQRRCFHFSNLQPLWAIDNLKKSNNI